MAYEHKLLNYARTTMPAFSKRLVILFAVFVSFVLFLRSGKHHHLPYVSNYEPNPTVTLVQGTYVGSREKFEPQTLEQFRGIPYALSTGENRRFAPPVPVAASSETFDASDYGNVCPSGAGGDVPDEARTEDCLNLNIYRPKNRPPDKKLPVVVHMHGGSFNFGSGRIRRVDNMLAWSAEPFIGVTFNYRMGAFGFLSGRIAQEEGLLNSGLKDQELLLQWVQDNIAEFGGDPGDVTVFGESAGAHSVCIMYFRIFFGDTIPSCKYLYLSNATIPQTPR